MIESRYFDYLVDMVGDHTVDGYDYLVDIVGDPSAKGQHYGYVLKTLHRFPFVPKLPNDDNRAVDGLTLREQYLRGVKGAKQPVKGTSCSMLEMLIALSMRMEFVADDLGDTAMWFWQLLSNADLLRYTDAEPEKVVAEHVAGIVYTLNEREYGPDGHGGLFPMNRKSNNPDVDQREVEIWYQMHQYINGMLN